MADWTAVERCRKPSGFGRRHLLAILGFSGFALSYAMRFCLSIAIVAMVNNGGGGSGVEKIRQVNSSTLELPQKNAPQRHSVLFKSDICPHDTTPHATLDLKLNLYHIQTTFVDKKSNNIDNENRHAFEVHSSTTNSTKISLLPKSSTDEGNKSSKSIVAKSVGKEVLTTASSLQAEDEAATHVQATALDDNDQEMEQGEFSWNEKEQGVILGSFFWGYFCTQIIGGWISQSMGGKWPFGIGLLITGLFAIVTPSAARLGGLPALVIVRIIQGIASGVTVPSMQAIISKWFPPEERGKLGSFTLAGMPFGTFISTLCSGFLIHYFGWATVFYVTGLMTIFWFICWSCFAHATPGEDPAIGKAEFQYIQAALQRHGVTQGDKTTGDNTTKQQQQANNAAVPWCRVLCSLPFWSILICNTCETWQLYTINAELPTYMKTVLHFDIKQNSVMSAFPHLLTLIVSVILTNVGDTLIEHKFLSIGIVRKLCTSIALWGSAAALFGVAYSGCDRVKTVALLAVAIGANGGKFGGFLVNIIDIAPNYAGILMGLINTIASMPGFFAPWVAGMIINENPSLENWRSVFLITAAISFFGNLVFILCSSGEEQSWNRGGGGGDSRVAASGTDKTLQSPPSSMECINQVMFSRSENQHNNEKECADNGVYIIPLNLPVEAIQHQLHHQDENHQKVLLPLISIRNNAHQDE